MNTKMNNETFDAVMKDTTFDSMINKLLEEKAQYEKEKAHYEAVLNDVFNAEPAQMTTAIGMIPIDSTGMRAMADALRITLFKLSQYEPNAVDEIKTMYAPDNLYLSNCEEVAFFKKLIEDSIDAMVNVYKTPDMAKPYKAILEELAYGSDDVKNVHLFGGRYDCAKWAVQHSKYTDDHSKSLAHVLLRRIENMVHVKA